MEMSVDDKQNPIFVFSVNELPGICPDAPTLEKARVLIKDAMIGAFRLYTKLGEEVPEP